MNITLVGKTQLLRTTLHQTRPQHQLFSLHKY